MILINNYKASLIPSQAHAKSNKKEILDTFVTIFPSLIALIPSAII